MTLGKKRASLDTVAASLGRGTHEEPKHQKDIRTGRVHSRPVQRHLKKSRRRERGHAQEARFDIRSRRARGRSRGKVAGSQGHGRGARQGKEVEVG